MKRISRRSVIQSLSVASLGSVLGAKVVTLQKVVVTQPSENRFQYAMSALRKDAACKLTSSDSAGVCSIFELIASSRTGPPKHIHHHEDEWYYVLEGKFLFEVGGVQHMLPVGGTIFAPKGIAHVWANIAPTTGRLILLCQPGGFEHFFDVYAKALADNVSADQMNLVMKRYGMAMVGPPMFAASK